MDKPMPTYDDLAVGDPSCSSAVSIDSVDAKASSIIFCIAPEDPIMKKIKVGVQVTYDLVQGDNGQYYAVNVDLAT